MRGDLALDLRLLARREALTGLVVAAAGVTAIVSAYAPWYEVTATLDLLGARDGRAVATLAGWEAHPWGWAVVVLGLAALVAGAAAAVDRPLGLGRDLVIGAGFGLGATVVAGGLRFPPVERFDVAGSRLRELAALAGRLPADVDLTFEVRPATGVWSTLAAATLLVTAALLAGRRD